MSSCEPRTFILLFSHAFSIKQNIFHLLPFFLKERRSHVYFRPTEFSVSCHCTRIYDRSVPIFFGAQSK